LLGHREVASEGRDGCPIRVLRAADAAHDKINGLDEPIGGGVITSPCCLNLWAKSRQQVVGGGLEALDIAKGSGDEHGPL
jgi:hypothetical protein